ncbi:MAG: PilC/PilY family type IV pilus protein [Pseudomonadota bacterium]
MGNRINASLARTYRRSSAWTTGLIACGVTLLAGTAAADDTEIFVQAIPPADPNVLMILDTSGSMGSELVVSEDYDPGTIYEGECILDRLYYVRQDSNIQLPECTGFSLQYTLVTSFFCDAANEALLSAGFYTDRFAQWDRNDKQWEKIAVAEFGEPPGELRPIECETDSGEHGDGLDLLRVYAVAALDDEVDDDEEGEDEDDDLGDENDDSPWTADENNELDWNGEDIYTMYSANYINWLNGDRGERVSTRMEVLKDVGQDLIASVGGVNVGLMRFSSNSSGGMVVHPVTSVNDPANRTALLDAIEELQPGGDTPLAETLFEAQRYLTGGPVLFGIDSLGNGGAPLPSVPGSRDGDIYRSPLTELCQANYVVLLTDGLPVEDQEADEAIAGLNGAECSGSCLDELSIWLSENDLADSFEEVEGEEEVSNNALTYTIGFFTDDPLLLDAATATRPDGLGRGYYTANDTLELSDALSEVFTDIDADNDSFQSPAVAVDGFNRLVNSDDLFFTMFVPSAKPHWAGNIKKYRLAEVAGVEGADATMEIVDADGRMAIDEGGKFFGDARSFWSSEADGADVSKGGIRNRMGTARTIFTDTGFAGANVDLWLPENRFEVANDLLTAAMLNVEVDQREAAIQVLSGLDSEGNAAPIFGDPLHSNPTLVTFANSVGETSLKMFVATNDGYFHAINVQPSNDSQVLEDWSFIPSDLLGKLYGLIDNEVLNPSRKGYGLDGPLSFWIQNDDGDRVVEPGETLYVYFSMRRGGRNYFALRIPGDNPDQPTLAWTLRGGTGNFAELGQSWSAATVADMTVGGERRTVLVMGGGYDPLTQDPVGPPKADDMGRAVFIIDALTGERLWWAGPTEAAGGPPNLVIDGMINSIPSDVAVVDTGGDGLADRLYVGDMGGHVWRFDITDLPTGDDPGGTSGTLFADLGSDADAGNRRFYYAPSISRVLDEVYGSFLTVALGTGHRASPLSSSVDDRFYMLRDGNVFAPPVDEDGITVLYPDPIIEGGLLDITENVAPTAEQLNGTKGWLLRLSTSGEKNLSAALTADGKIFFSSYLPNNDFEPACNFAGVLGEGRLYTADLVSGAPVLLDDGIEDGNITPEDRFQQLDAGGIPPTPRLIFTECDGPCLSEDPEDEEDEGDEDEENVGISGTGCENPFSQVTLVIGVEVGDPGICNAPVRTFWRQNK